MIIPIKCFTCGTILANKYRFYCEEVRKRKLKQEYELEKIKEELDLEIELEESSKTKSKSSNENITASLSDNRVLYLTPKFDKKTPEGQVLDELGLTKMCCRRHMLTHVDIE